MDPKPISCDPYHPNHQLVTHLPDDHLNFSTYDHETRKNVGYFKAGHLDPRLLADLEEMHRHMARVGLLAPGMPDAWDLWFEWVPVEHLPLQTMSLRTGEDDGKRLFEFRVRKDMISKDLVKELNEWSVPFYLKQL
jgi:hypothetical protein